MTTKLRQIEDAESRLAQMVGGVVNKTNDLRGRWHAVEAVKNELVAMLAVRTGNLTSTVDVTHQFDDAVAAIEARYETVAQELRNAIAGIHAELDGAAIEREEEAFEGNGFLRMRRAAERQLVLVELAERSHHRRLTELRESQTALMEAMQ